MRKVFCLLVFASSLAIAAMATTGCSKNGKDSSGDKGKDKSTPSASIVGKWKLTEREDNALPKLNGFATSPKPGTIFHFKKDKKLDVYSKLFDLKGIFPGKNKESGGPGLGFGYSTDYKVEGKVLTIGSGDDAQKADIINLTESDLVLKDKKKKSMKFKRQK